MNTFASNSWKILRRSGDIERKLASLLSFTNFALLTFLILSLASCLLLVHLVDIALVIVCSSLIFLGPVFFMTIYIYVARFLILKCLDSLYWNIRHAREFRSCYFRSWLPSRNETCNSLAYKKERKKLLLLLVVSSFTFRTNNFLLISRRLPTRIWSVSCPVST